MKELFTVGNQPFDNKVKAKEYRDNETPGFPVLRGKDHMGKHGHPVRHKKHRTNRKFI